MLEQKKSGDYRSKKEKFEIFLLCYFAILLTLTIFYFNKDSFIDFLIIIGWIIFVMLLMVERFLIVKMASKRIIRKLNNYSHKYGLKSAFQDPVIVQYNPPKGINAAEAGLLLRCYASSIDMFSLLYLWSSKKYISIECKEGNDGNELIVLKRLKNLPDDVPIYQSIFFYRLFFGFENERILTEISEIDNCFDLSDLEKYGISEGRFKHSDFSWYYLFSGENVLAICVIALILGLVFSFGFTIRLVAMLSILKPLLKHLHKLKRTEKGDKLVEHLLGFRKFLLLCDEKKFESILKDDPLYYDEILSYAVVFGMETDLLKKLIPVLDKDIDPGDGTYGRWNKMGKFKKLT